MSIALVLTFPQIRNPLGAVVHCADAIDESLGEMKSIMDTLQFPDEKAGQRLRELVTSSAEAVQIITSCSSHQKRYHPPNPRLNHLF
jgi:hypothetical protein